MGKRGLVVLLAVMLAACTRVVESPRQRPAPPVAPITAGQAVDLLSEEARQGDDGNLFVTVAPAECSGVAREVDPPFIMDGDPAAHDGGHWVADAGREVFIEELVGVYPANFDPGEALAKVKRTIDSCRDDPITITAMDKDVLVFRLLPQTDTSSPDLVIWSFRADTWACDNAFVAAHNAAVEITACAETNGYDILSLAQSAAKRIDALANTTA